MIHERIIDKLDFIIIKNICSAKHNIQRIRRQATDWEKIFAKETSDKGLLSKIYKELWRLNSKKTNNLIKMGQRLLQTPHERSYVDCNKHKKRCSTSYVIKEIQIKTTVRYHYTPIRMAKIWNTTTPNSSKDVEQ